MIRTHDPGFLASEDSTYLRPLGYRDRHYYYYYYYIQLYEPRKLSCRRRMKVKMVRSDWIQKADGYEQWENNSSQHPSLVNEVAETTIRP
jgi:hypothetical protein